MNKQVVSILVLILALSLTVQAGKIEVNVEGIDSEKGKVIIGVYENGSFPETGKELKGAKKEADDSGLTQLFTELPPGNYAVSLFHDKNNNEELDKRLLGMPKEKYGFSNNVFNWYGGPPSFGEAMVNLEENERLEITIEARSWPPQV